MLKIERFESFCGGLPAPWQRFACNTAGTFDQTLPWFVEFERHLLEPGQHPHILAVSDDTGAPLALLPLRTDRIPLLGPVKVRALTALSNYYTAHFAPLSVPDRESETAAALVEGMLAIDSPAVIDLNPLAEDASLGTVLPSAWERRGFAVERYFRFGNWYLELAGRRSAQYLAALPGQLRSTLQRKGKKLSARADARVRIVTAGPEVAAAMEAYEAVYRSSWKVDEPHKEFIRAIAREFAERNWLRLGLVEIGSRVAAAQIWFVYRGTASIFKLAYDEEFADLSAGSLLTMALMQHVIDVDSVATVDYLCGDDAYKRDWMSARRERIGLRAVRRRSWPGALSYALRAMRRISNPAGSGA